MKFRYALSAGLVAASTLGIGAQQALQSGLDRSTFDASVRPQDDLFRHVNGGWLARTEMPADRAIYGTFVQLSEQAETDLAEIIQGATRAPSRPPGSAAQLIGDLYASFMDEATLNSRGATPIKAHLTEIDALKNTTELAELIGRFSMIAIGGPVDGYIEADAGDPTRVAVYLSQSGTALPDRDYYLNSDARFVGDPHEVSGVPREGVQAGGAAGSRGGREARGSARDRPGPQCSGRGSRAVTR